MKKNLLKNWPLISFFGFWVLYFAIFWSRALFVDDLGNFWAGHVNIWGDWAAHFTMGNAMAVRGLFIHSPFLLGANFSYPFVADFISAILLDVGVPLIPAFTVPSFFFSMLIVFALYLFYRTIFNSKRIAVLATSIFLFNGGIGFYYFIQDILASTQPWTTFLSPAHEYTRIDASGIKWISVIDSMIIPQRSFALGFSCALIALVLVYQHFFKGKQPTKKKWPLILVGLLLGFLPILHTHSFLACFIFLSWWITLDMTIQINWRTRLAHLKDWGIIIGSTSLIALPLLKIFFASNVNHNFFQWLPGWMAGEFKLDWLLFTWRNWGFTPLLAILGWLILYQKFQQKLLAFLLLPSFVIFGLSNLFLFQPWSWDNTKLLVWFLLGSSGLIAYFLSKVTQTKSKYKFLNYLKLPIVLILFFLVTASGMIDAYRIQRTDLHSYIMYSNEELALASWTKDNTSPNSIWLTGHPHNHWEFNLTGRQAVMAYPGWLWTQGYDYLPMQKDIQDMYLAKANLDTLLAKYHVDYIVIGPNERGDLAANETYFDQHFALAHREGATKIYQVH